MKLEVKDETLIITHENTYNIIVKYKGQEVGTWINVPKNLIKTILKVTMGPMVDQIIIRKENK